MVKLAGSNLCVRLAQVGARAARGKKALPNCAISPDISLYGIRTTEITLPERRPGAAHRCEDDGDPSRQASPGLRHQPEQGDRRQTRPRRQIDRGPHRQPQRCARRHSHRGAQQRRRSCEPFVLLANHGTQRRRRADRQAGRRYQSDLRQLRRLQGKAGRCGSKTLRQRLGLADQEQERQAGGRLHRESGQPADGRATRRCWASTSGSTPTT